MYRTILKRQPGNVDALRLLGNVLRRTGRAEEAVGLLEKAVRIKGNVADNQMELGSAAAAAGRMDVAVAALQKAIELKPALADAYGRLAHLFLSSFDAAGACRVLEDGLTHCQGDIRLHKAAGDAWLTRGVAEKALEHYRQVLAIQPQAGAPAHADLGSALRVLGRLDEAIEQYDTALSTQRGLPNALAGKAEILESLGRTEDALALIEPAVRTGQQVHPDCALTFARLAKRSKRYEDGLRVIERVTKSPSIPIPYRSMASMAMGELLEAAGDCDRAFESYTEGNRLYQTRFEETGYVRMIDVLLETFSQEAVGDLARSGSTSERPLFILGMPRSGTSLVEQILSSHPDVFGAGELTEIPNLAMGMPDRVAQQGTQDAPVDEFPMGVVQLHADSVARLTSQHLEYLDTMNQADRYVTDKLPNNYLYLGLIWMLFPQARVIHCTRHPVETCFSCFATRLSPVHGYANNLLHTAVAYRQYRRVMGHWKQVLPDLQILDVPYEQVVDDPEHWTRALLEFCDLPWDDACLKFYESKRVTRTASIDQVRQPIYRSSVKRSDKFGHHLDDLRAALADFT